DGEGVAVDREDDVAGLDAGLGGGPVAGDAVDEDAAVEAGALDGLEVDPDVGARDAPVLAERVGDAPGELARAGEAHALPAAGVHADDVAADADERAAGVAGVDQRVVLDPARVLPGAPAGEDV